MQASVDYIETAGMSFTCDRQIIDRNFPTQNQMEENSCFRRVCKDARMRYERLTFGSIAYRFGLK